ncbi:Amino acid adenylation [Metarhizium album ARSEF 1941]|uniref:Amino acid adenylation n=1 Tax=Metarhizium album (strain ARSEF 1941) TaxID=1081103 RepID=A0A0B2WVA7_METAS|nr:Amino acid adenylation [Metarhizium album ARSEF 1941]KHN97569.1 Amino acid adenylation [Metarhizium album ARSEF 1941]
MPANGSTQSPPAPSVPMPPQKDTERTGSLSEEIINGANGPPERPSTATRNGNPASLDQGAKSDRDREPRSHGEQLKPTSTSAAAAGEHLEQIWEWNSTAPTSVERRVGDLIDARVQAQPRAPAVCAWDGKLTYGELDDLAAKLASRLCLLGVGPDVLVPLCLEKSMWTTVAVLGVIKAGGAFVLLDPSLPEQRLQVILDQLQASVMISSSSNGEMSSRLAREAIVLSWDLFTETGPVSTDQPAQQEIRRRPSPSSLLYAVFTSGSTGMPKGVLITNANAASALHHQAECMGMSRDARIFDFASYSFDVSVSNVLSALTTGGCLCVPSDEDRKDNLERSIASLEANILDITPSMAQVLSPERIPSVKTVIFGGEALHPSDVRRWWGKVNVIHIYGPCECTPTSTINYNMRSPDEAAHIGKGVGLVTWIVDPDDDNTLLPPGCTGELLLEGPLVGRGYLNDDAKTAAAFIKDPEWLLRGSSTRPGRHGRLYKTGDLVQYTSDGCLRFVGRKQAAQVKIRGQRLELGEIEHTLRNHAMVDEAVAALQHEDGQESRIVSFVTVRDVDAAVDLPSDKAGEMQHGDESEAQGDEKYNLKTNHQDDIEQSLTNGQLRKHPAQRIQYELFGMLKSQLPLYMVPQVIEILDGMPLNRNGKIDRLALVKGLESRTSARGPIQQPASEAQRRMLQVWAQVLNLDACTIGIDASFFHLGGSSISAMKVVAEARRIGIKVSVADIFRHPVLRELVDHSHQESLTDKPDEVIAPFSLLSDEGSLQSLLHEICSQYDLSQAGGTKDDAFIHDAYPCTPLQEGLMSLTSVSPGSYIGQYVLQLSPRASVEKLCAAWEQVVRRLPILRTRLVHHDRVGLVQIVVDEPVRWIEAGCLDDYLKSDIEQPMDLGQPLTRYALIQDAMGIPKWFVWTIHHALYDGWSMPLMLDAVRRVYRDEELQQGPQFQAFVKYVRSRDDKTMRDYWLGALEDCQCVPFPSLPPHMEKPMANESAEYSFPPPQSNRLGITPPIMIRAAWALLVGKTTDTDDIVFGATLFGRNTPLENIEMMTGPTFATVPVRMKWNEADRAVEYLEAAQRQATGMMAYEQIGLRKLAELSSGARQACKFQTLLVIQPEDTSDNTDELGTWRSELGQGERYDSHGLMLIVQLGADTVRVSAHFDSRMIEAWRVNKLLNRLGYVVAQLDEASADLVLSDVQTVTPEELTQIWHWNHKLPETVEQCVHERFQHMAQTQPQACAVCAWDGEWTYSELDEASTAVAHYLVSLGLEPEQIVPLCFEKSRWTPVAMLAVMKAGGASVALDATQPEERLRTIVQQTESALMLCSWVNADLARRLSRQHVVEVDDSLLARLKSLPGTSQLPAVTPSSKLYVAFTSGSTGVPKGAVITHSNFSSAIHHLRSCGSCRVEPTARVYDFASYAFDISWFNNLQSLASGACLCIPSESDRRNDLAASIRRLRATFAILTPSTANLLPLETIGFLETLMLAGEALPSEYARRWVGLTQLKNGYGPCECTPISTVAAIDEENVVASDIGRGVGVNTWIVHPSNQNRLVPIGDVGELVLEGPLVGGGYLGDAKQTAAAFIHDPDWLLHGAPGHSGRQGRLYKTGDLARYNSHGGLVFVGRKDSNQVKIRGQRVELGDVEHHLHASIPAARQVAAEVILPTDSNGQGRPALAAFLVVDDQTASSPVAQVMSVSADVEHELARRLPAYMVPTVYFSLRQLPTNSSGKVDRRRLRELGAGFTLQQLAQLRSESVGDKRAPATEMEKTLQKIWSRVLGIAADKIGCDDSFFRLGGDSITAMQASAAARGLHLNISTADILRSKTITLLAAAAASSKHHLIDSGAVDAKGDDGQPFQLSPIQQLYAAMQPHPNQCFDQTFHLKLCRPVTFAELSQAVQAIVTRHPMLRARFFQVGKDAWKQRVVDDACQSFHLSEVVVSDSPRPSKSDDMRQCRERLDIENGPILAAVLFDDAEGQTLFIAIHHLVIDLVSWRILLEELESLLMRHELSPSPTTSFQTWCSLQAQYATKHLQEEVQGSLTSPSLSYWQMGLGQNLHGATVTDEFILDEDHSSAILGACNEAFGTRPVELMIAALAFSFSSVFTDRPLPAIFSEGHGREPWDGRIDLSRTIGWFTTIFPAFVADGAALDLVDTIRRTKDSVRSLSKNGWTYFTSRFANESNAAANVAGFPVEVLLNFAGSYQQLERCGSLFESVSVTENCHPESWSQLRRFALFEFNLHVDKGRLAVSLEYPNSARHGDLIASWVRSYKDALARLGNLLENRKPEWTLSDFPMAFKSYADVDEFQSVVLCQLGLKDAQDIEDIFPCTGLQEGLLVAQLKSSNNYRVVLDFEIRATEAPGDCIDLVRIERAWQAVVRRHALLRSILVDVVPGSSRTMHVVLKDPKPSISFDQCVSETCVDHGLAGGGPCSRYGKYDLQHHLSISKEDEKFARICFEVNHVILDGHSTGVMLRDFWQAYSGTLLPDAPSFGDFIRYAERRPRDANQAFWAKYLEDAKPCLFPRSKGATGSGPVKEVTVTVPGLDASKIHDFCSKWEVTTASVMQTAWAVVLHHFTGCANPCFGNLASCRDVPIDRLEDMFGPVIAMVPYRVRLGGNRSVIETLREAQKDFVDSLPHQTFSLMEIHETLGIGSSGLFNTILSFQRLSQQPTASPDGHTIRERACNDPVEYPISLSIGDSETELSIDIAFKGGFISDAEAGRVAKAMGAAVSSLISEPHKKISNESLLTRDDLERIWTWNSAVSGTEENCVGEVLTTGKRAGVLTWVVDPRNHDSLLPPGCVGELLLEGPLDGCDDLGDRLNGDAAYIEDPAWLLMGVPGKQNGRHGRLYKTGDLVRYDQDGSLVFFGRKEDTQAMLDGQSIELGEIEYWVQNYMPETDHVAAEVIEPQSADLPSRPLLGVFVQFKDPRPESCLELLPMTADVERRLAKHLPAYMVPSLLFSLPQLPMTTTGNIDRKQLREIAARFTVMQLENVRTARCELKRQPRSEVEKVMRDIWARVLNVSVDVIGLDDNFFRLGGDSILSMRLVSEARDSHINMTVADVFHRETLAELVNGRHVNGTASSREPGQVVLVDADTKETLLTEIDSLGLNIHREDIVDILPATCVQERCFVEGIYPVMCVKQDKTGGGTTCGRFANYVYVDLHANPDVSALHKACTRTLDKFPILRACFMRLQGRFWQVVLHQIQHPLRVQDVSEDLDVALANFCLEDAHKASAAEPPVALVLLRHKNHGGRLIIRMSHAQYDGVCLPTIIESFINADITTPPPPSFSALLSHASSRRSKSIEYWTKLLQGSRPGTLRKRVFPQRDVLAPQPAAIYIRAETNLPPLPGNTTPATLASAAWALLLSRMTGQHDVVYGHLVAGRNSAIAGIDKAVGCCLNFIPVRVGFQSTPAPAELLSFVQEQFLAVGEADSLGYRDIIKECTDWPPGSAFESTIQHQNIDENPQVQSAAGTSQVRFFENPHLVPTSIHMVSQTRGRRLCFELNSNTHIMGTATAQAMVDGLVSIVDEFNPVGGGNCR